LDRSPSVARAAHPLNDRTLHHHADRVDVPTYDRAALTPAVVHLSVGCFHRSHQAVAFDDLARAGEREWGLVGVGLRRREMKAALDAQNGLYTVVERGGEQESARVVGVIGAYHFAPEDPEAVLGALADPRTRLVTLTMTASAYHVDPSTGVFDADAEELVEDLAHPQTPTSALGYLVEGLDRRRRAGLPPFTVLSCDNLMDSGRVTRQAVVSYARMRDERLADWIDANGAFPGSMVDRITPKTTPRDIERLERTFGVQDRWPVVTEPFSQWIVEDEFCNGRPPLERVGVQFVPTAKPYSIMKTRLLNAVHLALGNLGTLVGHERTHEALADPLLRAYVTRVMAEEIAPHLPAVAGIDLEAYQATLVERLSNPRIGDQLHRLCRGGSVKLRNHILTSVRAGLEKNAPSELLTVAVAGWITHLQAPGAVDDPMASRLQPIARACGTDPRPLLAERAVFGDLARNGAFVAALERALLVMDARGARAAIAEALEASAEVAA
jgi:mannitol 2-dehydrogenase